MFFNNVSGGTVVLDEVNVPDIATTKGKAMALLQDFAPGGRCLVHIDEHRLMINLHDDNKKAEFLRGAIQTLAEVPTIVVVATYTRLLTEIDPAGSSNVCRYPVAVPLLDIDAMAKELKDFDMKLPDHSITTTQSRLLSSARFRLAQKLVGIGLMALHGAGEIDDMDLLRRSFKNAVDNEIDFSSRLRRLLSLLQLRRLPQHGSNSTEDAVTMLCGVPEEKWGLDTVQRQATDILLTPNGYVTSQLNTLFSMDDPTSDVYSTGRDRFSKTLCGEDRVLLSSTPLEGAYTWVLSTRAGMDGTVYLGRRFKNKCSTLSPGRLFLKSFREDFEERYNKLEENTFYYALEGTDSGHKQDHPLCDLFFRTRRKELVLVDFTALDDAEYVEKSPSKLPVLTKRNDMIACVKMWRVKYNTMGVTLHGVILAPFNTETHSNMDDGDNSVTILQGNDAIFHLGGLSQFLFWFYPGMKVDDGDTEVEEKQESKIGSVPFAPVGGSRHS
ncbi:MAG: hypothetical protein SGILL_008942 [Bacillariaceae sp.]